LISPHQQGMKEFKHLSYASSLCGKCTEVCPVGIDIQKMLLLNRRDSVTEGFSSNIEKQAWKGFTYAVQHRCLIDFFNGKTKNFIIQNFFKNTWGKHSELPKLAAKSFAKQWKEHHKA